MSDWIEQVHALADGELAGAEKAQAAHLVASDPKANAEFEWAGLLKNHLRDKLLPVGDEETWLASKARLDAIDKTSKAQVFVGKYAWAFCMIFLVGIFSAATVNRMGGSRPLTNDHVAGLLNGLTPFNFAESSDAIKSVRRNVGLAPGRMPNIARLSLGYVDGRRAANMTLDDGQGQLNLYEIADTSGIEGIDLRDAGYYCGMINDAHAVTWTDSGYLFLLLGNRGHQDLIAIADQIRKGR